MMNKKTILIVDDTYENLYLLRVILEEAGFIVIEANDGSEGLRILNENSNVDLIISDILMPIMDGYLFCQECQKVESLSEIPFVFYTSTYTDKLDEEFGLKLGASNFLRKPIEHDELLRTVEAVFDENKIHVKEVKPVKKTRISEGEVLKLYSERLINKLEQKSLDLGNEVVERKKTEQLLIHKNEILDLIAVNTPLDKIFDRLLLNYESVHPDYFGSISLLDEDGIHLNLESAPSLPKAYSLAIKHIAVGKNVGSCGTAAFTKKPVIVSDISTDKLWINYKDLAFKHHLKSCWSIPILSKDNAVLGTFAIYSASVKTPSLDEIRELNFAVNLSHIAIEKFRIVEEIKKKDESYRSLIDQASDSIMTYSIDGTIHNFNKASYISLGYTEKEFLKIKIQDFNVGNIIQDQDKYKKLVKGEPIIFARKFKRKDQSLIDVEISAKLQKDGKMLGIARDVTERKKAEVKLLESEYSLRQSQVVANIGSYVLDLNTRSWESSAVLNKIFGINESYVKTIESWVVLIHPDEREVMFNYLENGIQNNRKFDKEYRVVKLETKEEIWVHGIGEFIFDNQGQSVKMIGTMQDISERKKAELELKSSKEFSENLINSMQNGLSVVDVNSSHIQVNPALCEITGYSEKELLESPPPFPYWPPEYYDEINTIFEKTLLGLYKGGETVFKRKNGERFPVQLTISRVKDEAGIDGAFFATVEDVSVKVKAREELRAAKEFTDKLIMSMQEGLLIVNLEGKIIVVNDSFSDMLGYSEEELIGLNLPYPFAKMEDFEEMSKTRQKVALGEALSFKFEFIRKNGETFLASFLSGNIKDDKGEVIALFGTIKDVSEEEKAKRILEENAEKSNQKKNVILELAGLVGTDYKKTLEKITTLAAETLNVARVGVWKFNNSKNEIESENLFDFNNQNFESGAVLRERQHPNYFKAIFKNKILSIADAIKDKTTESFSEKYLLPLGITSMMDIVIHVSNDLYGVLCFEHVGPKREWTTEEEEFGTSISNLVSLMIESTERKLAEENLVLANTNLSKVNKELNVLRDQLEQENVYLRNEIDLVFNYEEMVYGSEEFSNVLTEVEKVAPTNATVLLLGESGTGKELLARAVHNTSLRNKKPLIKVNCSAIPRELIESELFGHKKGSFTGAFADKIGKFELADGGTLFLDEIGELPLDMQPKILRFLQEGEIEVVGGTSGLKKLDVRVIAATNRNLKEEIKKKQFREDLYFRLNVFPIEVPPLRKRIDDIPLLVEHFVDKFNKAYDKGIKYISDDSMNQLKAYEWPGNIRELENLIERASILSNNDTLLIPGFESTTQKANQPINNKDLSLDAAQRNHILQVLEQCNWKISGDKGASVILDLKPSTLRDKMTKLGISKPTK